jgi:hypothetical protein
VVVTTIPTSIADRIGSVMSVAIIGMPTLLGVFRMLKPSMKPALRTIVGLACTYGITSLTGSWRLVRGPVWWKFFGVNALTYAALAVSLIVLNSVIHLTVDELAAQERNVAPD